MNRLSRLFLLAAVSALCLGVLGLFTLPATAGWPAAQAQDYSYARVVRLSLVEGQAQIAHAGADGWEQATANMPVQQGDTIATAEGRVEIEFESGATARLAENSALQITELALSDAARITRLTLTQGTATFYANIAEKDVFTVETPGVRVAVPENARFRVDAAAEGSVVTVWKGSVDVNSSAGTHRVSKGSTLSFQTNAPEEVSIGRSATPDAWDKWVADRDEALQTATSQTLQYTSSSQYYPGMADLYTYGSWYSLAGYGWGWRPYGATLSWTPFMAGSWGYFGGFGWTWVSYEPWGWLPYHYGGWVFSPTMGWLWCPGFNHPWRPATASFVQIGNQTGWVPRHPHDRDGQPPANLQHGVWIPNGRGLDGRHRQPMRDASVGTAPAAQVIAPQNNKRTEFLNSAPRDFAPRRVPPPAQAAVNSAAPTSPWRGQNRWATPGTPTTTRPIAPPPASSAQPAIVYDQREHRWVNNPNAPARQRQADAPATAGQPQQQMAPAQQAQPQQNAQPQAHRPPDGQERMVRPQPNNQSAPPASPPQRQYTPPPPQRQTTPPPPAQRTPPPPPPQQHMAPPPQAPTRSASPPPPPQRMAPPPPPPHMAPPPPVQQHMAPPPPPPPPHMNPPAQASPPPPPPKTEPKIPH